MQDGVLNLARVKLRDRAPASQWSFEEYSSSAKGIAAGQSVPRAGNDSGAAARPHPPNARAGDRSNGLHLFHHPAPVWEKSATVIRRNPAGRPHQDYARPHARLSRLNEIFARIEQ